MSNLHSSDASFTLRENIFPNAWHIQGFHEFETYTANEIYHMMNNGLIPKEVCVQDMFKKWHSMESDTLLVHELNVIHLIVKDKEEKEMKMQQKQEVAKDAPTSQSKSG